MYLNARSKAHHPPLHTVSRGFHLGPCREFIHVSDWHSNNLLYLDRWACRTRTLWSGIIAACTAACAFHRREFLISITLLLLRSLMAISAGDSLLCLWLWLWLRLFRLRVKPNSRYCTPHLLITLRTRVHRRCIIPQLARIQTQQQWFTSNDHSSPLLQPLYCACCWVGWSIIPLIFLAYASNICRISLVFVWYPNSASVPNIILALCKLSSVLQFDLQVVRWLFTVS